jgi:hypothetical protein
MQQCAVEDCQNQIAFDGTEWCTFHKCSYGRLKTCKNKRDVFKRCPEHRQMIYERQKKYYNQKTPNSRQNLLKQIELLQAQNQQIKEVGRRLIASGRVNPDTPWPT